MPSPLDAAPRPPLLWSGDGAELLADPPAASSPASPPAPLAAVPGDADGGSSDGLWSGAALKFAPEAEAALKTVGRHLRLMPALVEAEVAEAAGEGAAVAIRAGAGGMSASAMLAGGAVVVGGAYLLGRHVLPGLITYLTPDGPWVPEALPGGTQTPANPVDADGGVPPPLDGHLHPASLPAGFVTALPKKPDDDTDAAQPAAPPLRWFPMPLPQQPGAAPDRHPALIDPDQPPAGHLPIDAPASPTAPIADTAAPTPAVWADAAPLDARAEGSRDGAGAGAGPAEPLPDESADGADAAEATERREADAERAVPASTGQGLQRATDAAFSDAILSASPGQAGLVFAIVQDEMGPEGFERLSPQSAQRVQADMRVIGLRDAAALAEAYAIVRAERSGRSLALPGRTDAQRRDDLLKPVKDHLAAEFASQPGVTRHQALDAVDYFVDDLQPADQARVVRAVLAGETASLFGELSQEIGKPRGVAAPADAAVARDAALLQKWANEEILAAPPGKAGEVFARSLYMLGRDGAAFLSPQSAERVRQDLGVATIAEALELAKAYAIVSAQTTGQRLAKHGESEAVARERLMRPVLDHLARRTMSKLDLPSEAAARRIVGPLLGDADSRGPADAVRAVLRGQTDALIRGHLEKTGQRARLERFDAADLQKPSGDWSKRVEFLRQSLPEIDRRIAADRGPSADVLKTIVRDFGPGAVPYIDEAFLARAAANLGAPSIDEAIEEVLERVAAERRLR